MAQRLRFFAALSLLGLMASSTLTLADKHSGDAPQPPPLPPEGAEDTYLEPEITIVVTKQAVQYEYRINGQLYMIKVVPEKGKPYYLIDPNGTGEWHRSFTSNVVPPQWVIKQF